MQIGPLDASAALKLTGIVHHRALEFVGAVFSALHRSPLYFRHYRVCLAIQTVWVMMSQTTNTSNVGVSATPESNVATDFRIACGATTILTEFQGHDVNGLLLTVTLFSETGI